MAREADAESKRRKFEREKATLERIRRMEQLHEIHMSGISTKGGRRESEATAALMHIGLQKARTNLKRNALQHVRQCSLSTSSAQDILVRINSTEYCKVQNINNVRSDHCAPHTAVNREGPKSTERVGKLFFHFRRLRARQTDNTQSV